MQASGGGGGESGGAGAVYRGLRGRSGVSAMGEINVTPLVDVVLVLLLVFMVTAPMMSRGIDVQLPVANVRTNDEDSRITVSIREDGRVFVGDNVVNLVLLEDRVRAMMSGRTSKVVYLRADERLR